MKTRKYLRVPFPVEIRYKSDDDHDFRSATLEDISWGGVFIADPTPLPPGKRIVVQFDIPDQSVFLEIWGTVVRNRTNSEDKLDGMGVQFDMLDDDTKSQIQDMITKKLRTLLAKS